MRSAFAEGLRLLARRELSEAQIRERLARKAFEPSLIEDAIERLRRSGAVDDTRVALAAARTEALVRRHGRLRARRQLAAIGIPPDVAASAVEEAFAAVDEPALIDRALARRLRGPNARIADAAHFRRLHQYLVRQGFPPETVTTLLRRKWRGGASPDPEL